MLSPDQQRLARTDRSAPLTWHSAAYAGTHTVSLEPRAQDYCTSPLPQKVAYQGSQVTEDGSQHPFTGSSVWTADDPQGRAAPR